MQRRIPTLLGVVFLIVALGVGVFFIGKGPGVFAPRATPETTPKKIKVTNVTDNGFTLSFLTDSDVVGFVKYGTTASEMKSKASDDRDQLSGGAGSYKTHHITVRGLSENTSYYYVLGTGSGATFDNNGSAFQIKTARRSGAPSAAKTIHGTVTNQSGGPADGAIVYVSLEGAGEMSSLVKNSGAWAVPLSNARTSDGSAYATILEDTQLKITAQGSPENMFASIEVNVNNAQPVQPLALGTGAVTVAESQASDEDDRSENTPEEPLAEEVVSPDSSDEAELNEESEEVVEEGLNNADTSTKSGETSEPSGGLDNLLDSQPSETESLPPSVVIVDIEAGDNQEVHTTQPTIVGKAAPNTKIKITVNSDTQIISDITTGDDGSFELDISELGKDLEPGEHTVTTSYIDPNTGEEVTRTVTFYVAQTASASTGNKPFGSGNPYPADPTPTDTSDFDEFDDDEPTETTRSGLPSTASGIPVSGSVGTTMALMFGGAFFIISGIWSFWVSGQINNDDKKYG